MNIHEYQAKYLLKKYNINVPNGFVAFNMQEVESNLNKIHSTKLVVKAQIHAGGRGKAGGIKLANNAEETKKFAKELFGKNLITKQTGQHGQKIRALYIEQASENITSEYYLSLLVDRETANIAIIASQAGGMDIEEVASKTPEKIIKILVDIRNGLQNFHIRNIGFFLGLNTAQIKNLSPIINNLYNLLVEKDASQIEINPLIKQSDDFIALDAKINFDDNALYRHPDISTLKDEHENNHLENEASKHDLSYIKTDGIIGCIVNGAGLAMATMDIIKYYGSSPANFLDVGGNASTEKVYNAFNIILADKSVKVILINIFGGIVKCDIIANGIVKAAQEINTTIPIIVRLSGTNHEKGNSILAESKLNITSADTLEEAAKKTINKIK